MATEATEATMTSETTTQGTVTPALFDEHEQATQTQPEQTEQEVQALQASDITLPEGYEYNKELGDSFLGILNDEKLSRKELGQKLFDLYQSQSVKFLDGLKAAEEERMKKYESELAEEKATWLKQCEGDKEYGGQNWEAAQAIIDRGCKQLATPEAVKLMQSYNLNTHPEIVRMFYRAGKLRV